MIFTDFINSDRLDHTFIDNTFIVFISKKSQLSHLLVSVCDVIVVHDVSLIKEIRRDDELYLKPVFIYGVSTDKGDGVYDSINTFGVISRANEINNSCEIYEDIDLPINPKERLLVKLTRFMITRDINLSPIVNSKSRISYSYSLLEDLCEETDPVKLLEIMDEYSEMAFFKTMLLDRVHVCLECEEKEFQMKSCCEKCHSEFLSTEEFVHHFQCNYIAPASEFSLNGGLHCEGCKKNLDKVGEDFTFPLQIHKCMSCSHETIEEITMVQCSQCGVSDTIGNNSQFDIYSFELTGKAIFRSLCYPEWMLPDDSVTKKLVSKYDSSDQIARILSSELRSAS